MQTPEKLTLIGGSILLASTLVFTLKSQASNILPKVDKGMTSLFKSDKDRQADQQKQQATQEKQAFDKDYQRAQQEHWQTGTWGTAKFYVDDQGNMHVGSGKLSGSYTNLLDYHQVKAISLDEDVQAPQDSSELFGRNSVRDIPLININNLSRLDTSQATNMFAMFWNDNRLRNMDLSHFDTSHVTDMAYMFGNDYGLANLNTRSFNTSQVTNMSHMFYSNVFGKDSTLDVSNFDTSRVTNMSYMFYQEQGLQSLDLNNFNTSQVTNMSHMFDTDLYLTKLNVSNFDTKSVTNMNGIFSEIEDLPNLNLSNFNTSHVTDMSDAMYGTNITRIRLGPDTKILNNNFWGGTYKNGNQALNTSQLADGNAHPGTWTKQ